MKPWQKSNYVPPEEDTTKATVSVDVAAPPPPASDVVVTTDEYKCPVCGRTFKKKVSLVNHLRAHKRRGEIDNIVV